MTKQPKLTAKQKEELINGVKEASTKYLFGSRHPKNKNNAKGGK